MFENVTLAIQSIIHNVLLFEIPNFGDKHTGLKTIIWIDHGNSKAEGWRHGPRIKVSKFYGKIHKDNHFAVSISKNPHVLHTDTGEIKSHHIEDVKDWIKLNHDHLIDHYHGKISDKELKNRIQKI